MKEYPYKIDSEEYNTCKCQELYKQGKFVGGACGCKICDDCGRWYTCRGTMGLNAQIVSDNRSLPFIGKIPEVFVSLNGHDYSGPIE